MTDEEKYYNDLVEGYKNMTDYDWEERESLQSYIDGLKRENEQLKGFYNYFSNLYGQGLGVANWHLNGELEPFDEFFDSAEQCKSESL